jgi:hypothetical protein
MSEQSSILRSPHVARVVVLAFGIAVLAQITQVQGWHPAWLLLLLVAAPIALTFVAPWLGACLVPDRVVDLRSAWWRVAPLLFAPWIFATFLNQSWQLIPWESLGSPPRPEETVKSFESMLSGCCMLGMSVTLLFAVYLWVRSGVLARNGVMAALGTAIVILTSIGGFFVKTLPIP